MPQIIPTQQLPNQSLSITLDGVLYDVTIRTTDGITNVSISQNGALILENAIAVACGPIIPSPYMESGNFLFLTANHQLPNYEQFGLTQSLFYLSPAELAAFRKALVAASPAVPTITANDFNPIAQLPLRFAPQGYVEG